MQLKPKVIKLIYKIMSAKAGAREMGKLIHQLAHFSKSANNNALHIHWETETVKKYIKCSSDYDLVHDTPGPHIQNEKPELQTFVHCETQIIVFRLSPTPACSSHLKQNTTIDSLDFIISISMNV